MVILLGGFWSICWSNGLGEPQVWKFPSSGSSSGNPVTPGLRWTGGRLGNLPVYVEANEKKKLGGLALRLIERLQGPALQIARSLGVERLSKPDGVKVLLDSLEKDLLPIRRQAALELYQAGSTSGLLSRQTGEPSSSYCLRRNAWWNQLQDLDSSVKVSDSIRSKQLLQNAGLDQMEMKLVRTVCGNDLSDIPKLRNALRDQYGTIHAKERGQGGHRSFDKRRGWHGSYRGGFGHGKGSGSSYMAE